MKVLVLSHNSIFSNTNMGITASGLLASLEVSSICQINIRDNTEPNVIVPTYIMKEKQLVKSIFTRKNYWYSSNSNSREDHNKSNYVESQRNSFKLILRHIVWKIGKWKTKDLYNWIDNEKPTIIFVMPGDSTFIYDLAIHLSKKFNINIVTYFGDDYSQGISSSNKLISRIYTNIIFGRIKNLVNNSSGLVYISDSLNFYYNKMFNKPGITIMTPYTVEGRKKNHSGIPYRMVYIGNLTSGRFNSIKQISETLDTVNKDSLKINLDIYAPPLVGSNLHDLESQYVSYKGFIDSQKVDEVIDNSDILLHVETFDSSLFSSVKHSFSTKIANYLSSNRIIFSFGPDGLNSIDYLKSKNLAIVANSEEELSSKISKLLDSSFTKQIVENALQCSKLYHNKKINSDSLISYFEEKEKR